MKYKCKIIISNYIRHLGQLFNNFITVFVAVHVVLLPDLDIRYRSCPECFIQQIKLLYSFVLHIVDIKK